jgi:hypothetical protein
VSVADWVPFWLAWDAPHGKVSVCGVPDASAQGLVLDAEVVLVVVPASPALEVTE